MARRNTDPQQQFDAVEDLLTRWLKERRALLGTYTELVVSLQGGLGANKLSRLQAALCEILVDYVSAGHFEVFHELLREGEIYGDGGELAGQLMPGIGDTTEVILAYEEKYGGEIAEGDGLKRDLSSLGEILESRFMLEDRLIAGLHGRHRTASPEGARARSA